MRVTANKIKAFVYIGNIVRKAISSDHIHELRAFNIIDIDKRTVTEDNKIIIILFTASAKLF